ALAGEARRLRLAGAAAAALLAGFTFTAWQNSNETEVYMVATFSVAAIAWLCLRWRAARGSPRAAHLLLLVVYLLALSIGNHLMGLLVGPAVAAFLWHALRTRPAADPGEAAVERSEAAAVAALWVALVGVGLGNEAILIAGAALFLAATVLAARARAPAFPLVALLVAAVGVSTYAFLYIRSGLDPVLDMSDPETWDRLVSVIRREQYPPRGLLDDPRFLSGPDNPGRSPLLFVQQLVNYLQYFDWQWAAGVARDVTAGLTPRLGFTLVFAALGVTGLGRLRRQDGSLFALLGTLWLVTGLGLVVYMNLRPGFSLFWDQYRTMDEHEVRERDYFFTMSFQMWALFAGIGLVGLVGRLRGLGAWGRGGVGVLAVALVPCFLNFSAASRRHGPAATLARDWAHDMLQSVEPYGILFTYGDNDTYPLWYAQAVENVRPDIVMINLSLANTDWHLRQARDRVPGAFDPDRAPAPYADLAPPPPPAGPLFDLSDAELARLGGMRVDEDVALDLRGATVRVRAGTVLWPRDQGVLLVLHKWLGQRPVTFALSSTGATALELDGSIVLRGLAAQVFPGRPDTMPGWVPGVQRLMVDVERTEYLATRVYRYAGLFDADTLRLEPAARTVATSLSIPFLELGQAYT
ncbi:MAG: protein O-mannosyl-transferase family, partial [Gemmatimonadales bacterium]